MTRGEVLGNASREALWILVTHAAENYRVCNGALPAPSRIAVPIHLLIADTFAYSNSSKPLVLDFLENDRRQVLDGCCEDVMLAKDCVTVRTEGLEIVLDKLLGVLDAANGSVLPVKSVDSL